MRPIIPSCNQTMTTLLHGIHIRRLSLPVHRPVLATDPDGYMRQISHFRLHEVHQIQTVPQWNSIATDQIHIPATRFKSLSIAFGAILVRKVHKRHQQINTGKALGVLHDQPLHTGPHRCPKRVHLLRIGLILGLHPVQHPQHNPLRIIRRRARQSQHRIINLVIHAIMPAFNILV